MVFYCYYKFENERWTEKKQFVYDIRKIAKLFRISWVAIFGIVGS